MCGKHLEEVYKIKIDIKYERSKTEEKDKG
jgi:hypothetical protein